MDQTIPAYMATELHARLPTATLVIIEKGTHKAMHKCPEFFPAIVKFVT
jgi:pimeloyl-ACP methyl ester carboxylesterase